MLFRSYQAYLDTLEQLPTFEDGNSGFIGWATVRAGEFEKQSKGRVSANSAGHLAYVRQWADEHLSQRVKDARAAAEPVPAEVVPPAHEIIEYTTKKDKVLRGVLRTDLSLAEADRKSTRLNSSHVVESRMPSSA